MTRPLEDPALVIPAEGPPRSDRFGDVYHARAGARAQAQAVFLRGNGLPGRWQQRAHFVVLETGFGLGHNFLATWAAWADDPQACERLTYVAVEGFPVGRDALAAVHLGAGQRPHADGAVGAARRDEPSSHRSEPAPEAEHEAAPEAAQPDADEAARNQALLDAWPPLTPGVHRISLADGRLTLLLALGDVQALLPQLELQADAVFLDGFAPARNPEMWSDRVLAAIGRKAAPEATAASWCVARHVRDGLQQAGFVVRREAGFGGKRQRLEAVFLPSFVPRRAPRRASALAVSAHSREVLVIGGGLAGALACDALHRRGWRCTVIDQHAEPAGGASGNPAGIFHGVAHADDGLHARFGRAAALWAARCYPRWIGSTGVPGQCQGLLRLRADARAPGLDPAYLCAIDADEAAAFSGLPRSHTAGGAWRYAGGGWVAPGALCRYLIGCSGARWLGGMAVAQLRQEAGRWQALDAAGEVLADAPVVVLAQGAHSPLTDRWPLPALSPIRGQTTWFLAPGGPLRPVSGQGYAVSLPDGHLLCGASTQPDDPDIQLRGSDHAHNLQRLQDLTGLRPAPGVVLHGRVGWRATAHDRLPLVGPVPLPWEALKAQARLDQCRLVPREPGLWMLGGLASRGLTWGPLAAELMAAQMADEPLPLEADLVDAVDPARFVVRRVRHAAPG